jgi:hypothetical protein
MSSARLDARWPVPDSTYMTYDQGHRRVLVGCDKCPDERRNHICLRSGIAPALPDEWPLQSLP